MTHGPNLGTPFVSVLSKAAFETVEFSSGNTDYFRPAKPKIRNIYSPGPLQKMYANSY